MARICLLLMRLPRSDEEAERMYGMAHRAKERGMDVEIYLLGDGVFCAKKGQKQNIRTALEKGIFVRA